MNNLFEENKHTFLLLLGLFFILLIVLYFAYFRPLISELNKQTLAVSSLETEVSALEVKTEKLSESSRDPSALEIKIPLNRDLQNLLLTLQDIERSSNSHIDSIQLNYANQLPTINFEEENESESDTNNYEELEELEKTAGKGIPMDEKPDNLEVISVYMSVYSPDFAHLKQFIQEIEKIERITIISKLEFAQHGQLLSVAEQNEMISFTIELLTFYYPN